ncbi:MAG: sulfoxide reductase heme-binding subunit YedZ [Acidobacteria bacterium]|nr:sulfoxide reductase heme-binding subunit YedZ [Acidobacteriota bacterium]
MSNRTIRVLKPVVFLLCLLPFFYLVQHFRTEDLGADPVATITHFTGNWALYMLLGSLAITPIRRLSTSLGWLVRFRRMLGLFAFFYATLHLATYVFLFSGFDIVTAFSALRQHDVNTIAQQWHEVWPRMIDDAKKRPFIQIGLLAWCILLALALTSPQRVMRWMGGKRWKTLHRTVYGAAALAVIHYWMVVKTGVLEPWKVTAVLAVLLLARIVWQLRHSRPQTRTPTRI